MIRRLRNTKLSTILTIYVGMAFITASVIIVLLVNREMRKQALFEAKSKAEIVLDHNLATHHYFSHSLKPAVFGLLGEDADSDYFDPIWMSSTHAVRSIDSLFSQLSQEKYYYKECAINARSMENEADSVESAFLQKLNEDPDLVILSVVREIDGVMNFEVIRRGESMEVSCLRCHSTPDNAPEDMVEIFGPDRSFNREEGEVVSAISIRIPLDTAYKNANLVSLRLSYLLLLVMLLLYILQRWFYQHFLISRLTLIRDKAFQISTDESHLGEQIDLPQGRELFEMTESFNRMSSNLNDFKENLENKVAERTNELRESLENVKILRGLLPICASCKKIRDDKGYWNEVEVHINQHSEAEFSHGLCPVCAAKMEADMEKYFGKDEKD